MVWFARYRCAIASGVSTATMSLPLMATAPGESCCRDAFWETTVRPITMSETFWRVCAPSAATTTNVRTTVNRFMSDPVPYPGTVDLTLLYSVRVPLHIVDHPLVHDALVKLRAHTSSHEEFRQAATRISLLLDGEARRDLPTEKLRVHTPLAIADGIRIGCDIVVVPVLRAGLGMLDAVLTLVPGARVGHIGLQRDESTAIASQYYSKLPNRLDKSCVIIIPPMVATGGSAVAALDLLLGAGARSVKLVCIVSAPDGVKLVQEKHPSVEIYTPVIDAELNAQKYIVPGLGDFGDRLYGTV